jgi:hypothetical protein
MLTDSTTLLALTSLGNATNARGVKIDCLINNEHNDRQIIISGTFKYTIQGHEAAAGR